MKSHLRKLLGKSLYFQRFCYFFLVSLFTVVTFLCLNISIYWLGERERKGEIEGGGERNIYLLFHLFMHWLADSCMCPDCSSNPQPWRIRTALQPTVLFSQGCNYFNYICCYLFILPISSSSSWRYNPDWTCLPKSQLYSQHPGLCQWHEAGTLERDKKLVSSENSGEREEWWGNLSRPSLLIFVKFCRHYYRQVCLGCF